jgi:hypothetical protein
MSRKTPQTDPPFPSMFRKIPLGTPSRDFDRAYWAKLGGVARWRAGWQIVEEVERIRQIRGVSDGSGADVLRTAVSFRKMASPVSRRRGTSRDLSGVRMLPSKV